MDRELERYHISSAKLELNISDSKLKQKGLQEEVLQQRKKNADAEAIIKRLHHDLHETVQHIQDPKALKESVKRLYQKHVTETIEPTELDEDIQTEYNRQREYLERSVESLKMKLRKDDESNRKDVYRIMQENVSLIKEINELRREIKSYKSASATQRKPKGGGRAPNQRLYTGGNGGTGGDEYGAAGLTGREAEMQRKLIADLREQITDKDNIIKALEDRLPRPGTAGAGEKLEPIAPPSLSAEDALADSVPAEA